MADTKQFPFAEDVVIPPEMKGWEEMYAPQRLFSKDRAAWEKRHFWYQDKIHAADPLYPLDDIFQEAWQIALSQYTTRVFCIPPAQGVAQRILGCYMYISPVEAPPGAVIQQKAELFGKRVPYTFQNYERQWKEWLDKFHKLGREMEAIHIPEKLYTFVPEDEVIPSPKGYTGQYPDGELQQHYQPHFQGLAVPFSVSESRLPGLFDVRGYGQKALPEH